MPQLARFAERALLDQVLRVAVARDALLMLM
jgi:hypothetical protein